MNILIIGNGFDIAHGLPTTYKEFLHFITLINLIPSYYGTVREFHEMIVVSGNTDFNKTHTGVEEYFGRIIRDDANPHAKVKDTYHKLSNKVINEIIELSQNNIWFSLFSKSKSFLNEGWVDFESEISRVIKYLDLDICNSFTPPSSRFRDSELKELFMHYKKGSDRINDITEAHFNDFKKKLFDDLNSLTRCFELYLEDCVKNIDNLLISPDIYDLPVDKVLSFNYTDTYYRLYSCKNRFIEYDYIHGKSKLDIGSDNNMILGADEYLHGDARNNNTDFIMFKKYYQRIHKKTGCIYKKWIEDIAKSKEEEHHVYIFGHSLAIADNDVLKEFLMNEKIRTTIYYYDKKCYGQHIANLVKILGQDTLISMVYGSEPRIKFKMQAPMIDRTNHEWQILNDRYILWNSYNFLDSEINEVVMRVEKKISEKDLKYFHNQRNTISLFDVLITNHPNVDTSSIFEISKALYNRNTHVQFDSEEWRNIDYRGNMYPCDHRVNELIKKINEYNAIQEVESVNEYDIADLETLHQQLKNATLLDDGVLNYLSICFRCSKQIIIARN